MRRTKKMANYIIQERNVCGEREYVVYHKRNVFSSHRQVFVTDKVAEAYKYIIGELLSKQKITYAFANPDGCTNEHTYVNDFKINLDRFFDTDSNGLTL
jgi:hypothetical protein